MHGLSPVRAQDDSTDADIQEACDSYNYNNSQLLDDLFDAASINTDIEFVNIFGQGNPEKPKVKDLYLAIYKKVKTEPEGEALKATAEEYQFTQTQMCGVLGGDLAPIASLYEGENLSTTEAIDAWIDIKQDYEDNLADKKLEQEMFLDSYTREIFANGDTGDSSFDVLYDLEIIEYLLFGESGYSTESTEEESIEPEDSEDTETSEGEEASSEEPASSTSSQSEGEESETEETSTTEAEPAAATETEEEEPVTPASCTVASELQNAFLAVVPEEALTDETAEDEITEETPETGEEIPVANGETESESSADTDSADSSEPDAILTAEPNDWTSPEVCDSVFCLFINFENREDPSYTKTDNCISCHLKYIVKALEDTTSQSLTLGKVSGNLMEPPVCKNDLLLSLTKIDLNLFLIPMPIQTPPQGDIVQGLGFCDSIRDFMDDEDAYDFSLKNLFDGNEKGEGGICGIDPDSISETLSDDETEQLRNYGNGMEDALKDATTRSATLASVNELFNAALNDYNEHMEEFEQAFEDSYTLTRAGTQNELYQDLGIEMDQMTNYFSAFYESIQLTQKVAEELKTKLKPPE